MSDNVYVLSDSGHVAIARSIIEQELFLAWGKLIPKVLKPVGFAGVGAVAAGTLPPLSTQQYCITAYNAFGETEATANITVVLTGSQNTINLSWLQSSSCDGYYIYRNNGLGMNRIAKVVGPAVLTFSDTGVAVGIELAPTLNTTSDDAWTDSPPSAKINHTKLYNEVGRRRAITKKYVKPDVNGDIDTPKGRWSESLVPTRYVYLQVGYALTDAADQIIYQLGTYVGTAGKPGFENANYLLPDQILDFGTLFALSNVSPIYRNSSTREIRELVITF